ncbi:hypothetical protein T07_2978 [Trichinella nelsoni]|uniref:Uncharacterized protein n=1 Tax=Trichinella nelsoni TaxID=6336 RepID=A0A0V0SFX2_9BILA|nr:hypothetical protein T07_2978 [Trichinella nelsoni]
MDIFVQQRTVGDTGKEEVRRTRTARSFGCSFNCGSAISIATGIFTLPAFQLASTAIIDGPEWVRPPEVLAKSSNVETWFEHVELYFRSARITPERRAAIVQYHAYAEVRGVMKAMQI